MPSVNSEKADLFNGSKSSMEAYFPLSFRQLSDAIAALATLSKGLISRRVDR